MKLCLTGNECSLLTIQYLTMTSGIRRTGCGGGWMAMG